MSALDIHRDATTVRERLLPLTVEQLDALSPDASEEYALRVEAQVAGLMLLCPARDVIVDELSRVIRVNSHKRTGANTVLALTGPNGVGKSTLVHHWVDGTYRRLLGDTALADSNVLPRWSPEPGTHVTRVPIVWISPHGAAGKTAFLSEIARFLGYTGSRAASAALSLLARHGVQLLVVDDCHFLRTHNEIGRAMLDTLKNANDHLGLHGGTLLLVGANLDGGELFADQQIGHRLVVHRLPPFGLDTHTDKQTWQRHLKAWESHIAPYLPAAADGFLYRQAGLLWRLTRGYVRELHELLIEATTCSILDRSFTLTPDQLCAGTVSLHALEARHDEERRAARAAKAATRPQKLASP